MCPVTSFDVDYFVYSVREKSSLSVLDERGWMWTLPPPGQIQPPHSELDKWTQYWPIIRGPSGTRKAHQITSAAPWMKWENFSKKGNSLWYTWSSSSKIYLRAFVLENKTGKAVDFFFPSFSSAFYFHFQSSRRPKLSLKWRCSLPLWYTETSAIAN